MRRDLPDSASGGDAATINSYESHINNQFTSRFAVRSGCVCEPIAAGVSLPVTILSVK
jgi:hypothetical protein